LLITGSLARVALGSALRANGMASTRAIMPSLPYQEWVYCLASTSARGGKMRWLMGRSTWSG
jgi:hypothetical protein